MIDVKIITGKDCNNCQTHGKRVIKFFNDQINYNRFDYDFKVLDSESTEGFAEMALAGYMSIPLLLINDKVYVGDLPSNDELMGILKVVK